MIHVDGEWGDVDGDVVAVSKLRREIRLRHFYAVAAKDAMAKKAPLGKMAYRERVRAVCRPKRAQTVACAAVVKKKGAASGF